MELWELRARARVHTDEEMRLLMHQFVVTYWGGCRERAAVAFDEFAHEYGEVAGLK